MKTILVIEDTLAMRENIIEILQLARYTVVPASNGKQGVELARLSHPDLILCDIMMPELDGYGVLQILRQEPDTVDIPFIFLSAKAETSDFRLGMNLGADDYLIKPFESVTLLNVVALRLNKLNKAKSEQRDTSGELAILLEAIIRAPNAAQRLKETYPINHFKKKQTLFNEGNMPTALYFIVKGQVKLLKSDASDNTYITRLFGDGDFVGYLALLRNAPHSESAELLSDAEVCTIPKEDFMALIYNNQHVANQFISLLSNNIVESQERLLKLAYQTVRKRVAESLITFHRKFYTLSVSSSGSHVTNTSAAMTLSRENCSQLVGASTEAVIRTLSDFRAEGLIDISGSQITLLDINKLANLKN